MFQKPESFGYTVYTKSNCVYCDKVKQLLKHDSVTYIDCDEYLAERFEFLSFIENVAGEPYHMFPMVFYNKRFIGGYEQTKREKEEKEYEF